MSTTLPRAAGAAALAVAAAGAASLALQPDAPAQEPAALAEDDDLRPEDWPLSAAETRGRAVYERWCVGCHGDQGRGDGFAAQFLDPLPRDLQSGAFKFRSTPYGEFPLESDVMRTVACGLPGSSMPGFPLVPEVERRDVVRYVLHLARFGRARAWVRSLRTDDGIPMDRIREEHLPAIRADLERASASVRRVPVPPPAEATPESVARGDKLFQAGCAPCHGATGRGDGPSSYTLRDDWGARILPRDFTTGVFRAGSTPEDLFLRLRTGLSGTPMPASTTTDEETWDLVHFILSLRDQGAVRPKLPPGCDHEEEGR